MTDKELIKQEIERLKHTSNAYDIRSRFMFLLEIEEFINSLPEESGCEVNFTTQSEDLDEDSSFEKILQEIYIKYDKKISIESLLDIARHFAEWQKQKDEELFSKDTWAYIEENYPNITEEEKLRLYDISIKSRLAGAETFKKHIKEEQQ